MPYKNKEDKKAHNKVYREAHKEKEAIRLKAYFKTPNGKRSTTIASWKYIGATGDLKTFYDERYFPATNCEVCENDFKSMKDKCMDHCHTTGEIRWVLCNSCNVRDHWKKVLARKEEETILY